MAHKLARAVQVLLATCPYVVAVHDLLTKIRIELQKGYLLDLYYNDTLGKYSYTLIRQGQRVVGWDNAPHHHELPSFPHHFHREDGGVEPSSLSGNPEQDVVIVITYVNTILRR